MNSEQRNAMVTAIAQAVTVAVVEALERVAEPGAPPEPMPARNMEPSEEESPAYAEAATEIVRLRPFMRPIGPPEVQGSDEDQAAQEVADMHLELEMGAAFAPDESKRTGMQRLLEMLDAGDVARVRELGRKYGLFRPETLAELTVAGPTAEATPEQRAAQEAFKSERIAREVSDGPPRGEILQIGDRSPMIGAWGKSLAPGASARIAERRAE